jgi:hypothetical protein
MQVSWAFVRLFKPVPTFLGEAKTPILIFVELRYIQKRSRDGAIRKVSAERFE